MLAASRWEGADLQRVLVEELAPYRGGEEALISLSGPPLLLKPAAAQSLAPVIHELATNAVKYGALSVASGELDVRWEVRADDARGPLLCLRWEERGGPPVVPRSGSGRSGFGSRLIRSSIERQLAGTLRLDWAPGGLIAVMEVAIDRLVHQGGDDQYQAPSAIASGDGKSSVDEREPPASLSCYVWTMTATPDERRARMTALCGGLILLLALGALLLPEVAASSGALVIGELLLIAGLLEVVAATGRHVARLPSTLAGIVTLAAGAMFLAREETRFLPNLTVITFWLLLRVLLLVWATLQAGGSAVRRWTGLAAATDLALAAILILGLQLASIIVALFGATSELIASFSWVLALSFLATGAMLLQIAACEREGAA